MKNKDDISNKRYCLLVVKKKSIDMGTSRGRKMVLRKWGDEIEVWKRRLKRCQAGQMEEERKTGDSRGRGPLPRSLLVSS